MSKLALYSAAGLYFLAAIGPAVPAHMRVVLGCYGVANIMLAQAV
jgi:hypothetical protein